jgi:hypothetical protein
MNEMNEVPTNIDSGRAATAYVPQFSSAVYGKAPALDCYLCSNSIYSQYFLVNGRKVCGACADNARAGQTLSHSSIMSAMVFGAGGAILGMALYSAVLLSTGWQIGYVACIIGLIVGKAVRIGADGVGNARFQAVASLLTYAAIALDTLPVAVYRGYSHLGSFNEWTSFLQDAVYNGLIAPFQGFGTNSIAAILNLAVLFVGIRLASFVTRHKPNVVVGPYSVAKAA